MNGMFGVVIVIFSALLTQVFCRIAQNTRLMDKPNDRSLHVSPTVRGGGIVFIGLPLLLLPYLCNVYQDALSNQSILVFSTVLIALVSFLDDLFHLSVKPRFCAQAAVALLIAFCMRPQALEFGLFSLTNPFLIIPVLFFVIIWSINHFNFMDGIDGFCASQALFLFFSYALLFNINNAPIHQDFCLLMSFSLMGFLVFNFPPAKLFMGDVGSATLGLLVFCIALIAQQTYQIPIIYWFMLNALFLFDATITLVRRVLKKEKWTSPHKKHAYQRLKQLGVSTYTILFGQFIINALFLILVILTNRSQLNVVEVIAFQIGLMSFVYYLIEKRFPMFQQPLVL
jgi:UDP-N-acetylmuramyl pentapeptide phosphotransferase/UDP-N-acetylglucosamine-1-phosphate transferase